MEKTVEIDRFVNSVDDLPTLPGIAIRIMEAIQVEEPDIDELGSIISTDPPLSAKILKVANSSFYSLPTRITTINHAIKLLGIFAVKNLALSFSLIDSFGSQDSAARISSNFWRNAFIGSISAKLLAQKIQPSFSEDAFFLGLLQDIGMLVINYCLPKQYDLVKAETVKGKLKPHEAENQILGYNHMQVGKHLIEKWGLPDTFSIPIGHHHHPEKLKGETSAHDTLTKLLHLSSLYIDLFNDSSSNLNLCIIDHRAKEFGMDAKLDVCDIGQAIHEQSKDIFSMFNIEFKDDRDYANLILQAKTELINLSKDLVSNIITQKQEIDSLRQQVSRDSMTQLINHQSFREILDKEIGRAERYKNHLSILFGDVDHFKSINDTFGHPMGDQVIIGVANCLTTQLREADHVARYGGEEFAVILPETQLKNACLVAERLRKAVEGLKFSENDKSVCCTMSFGIAELQLGEGTSSAELINNADSALYKAKEQGRNRCIAFA
jgi:diguanylate cyclase (GGDEF)-like protein